MKKAVFLLLVIVLLVAAAGAGAATADPFTSPPFDSPIVVYGPAASWYGPAGTLPPWMERRGR